MDVSEKKRVALAIAFKGWCSRNGICTNKFPKASAMIILVSEDYEAQLAYYNDKESILGRG